MISVHSEAMAPVPASTLVPMSVLVLTVRSLLGFKMLTVLSLLVLMNSVFWASYEAEHLQAPLGVASPLPVDYLKGSSGLSSEASSSSLPSLWYHSWKLETSWGLPIV